MKEFTEQVKRWNEKIDKKMLPEKEKTVVCDDAERGHKTEKFGLVVLDGKAYSIPNEIAVLIREFQFCIELNEIDVDNCIDANIDEYEEFCGRGIVNNETN